MGLRGRGPIRSSSLISSPSSQAGKNDKAQPPHGRGCTLGALHGFLHLAGGGMQRPPLAQHPPLSPVGCSTVRAQHTASACRQGGHGRPCF